MIEMIGANVYSNFKFGGYTHTDFGKANDQVFMTELLEALNHLEPHDELGTRGMT